MSLALYRKVTIGTASRPATPCLQETPDPITKTTWDNYVTMARADMEAMGLNTYIAERDQSLRGEGDGEWHLHRELPAFPQPGQLPGTVGIALGYGRGDGQRGHWQGRLARWVKEDHLADAEGNLVPIGKNAFGLASSVDGLPAFSAYDVTVEATGEEYPLACTQLHHTIMGRDSVVKETTLDGYLKSQRQARKRGQAGTR